MNLSQYITPVSGIQYFICLIDYGRGPRQPMGFEAVVQPETTRRQIVEEVRECISRGLTIVHVKFVDDNAMEDVTHEIIGEAIDAQAEYDAESRAIDGINDRIAASRDHARALRAEGV